MCVEEVEGVPFLEAELGVLRQRPLRYITAVPNRWLFLLFFATFAPANVAPHAARVPRARRRWALQEPLIATRCCRVSASISTSAS